MFPKCWYLFVCGIARKIGGEVHGMCSGELWLIFHLGYCLGLVFFPLDRFLRLRSKTSLVNWDAIL